MYWAKYKKVSLMMIWNYVYSAFYSRRGRRISEPAADTVSTQREISNENSQRNFFAYKSLQKNKSAIFSD